MNDSLSCNFVEQRASTPQVENLPFHRRRQIRRHPRLPRLDDAWVDRLTTDNKATKLGRRNIGGNI